MDNGNSIFTIISGFAGLLAFMLIIYLIIKGLFSNIKDYNLADKKKIERNKEQIKIKEKIIIEDNVLSNSYSESDDLIGKLVLFPFRLLWNILVIVGTIWVQIIWLGFVFGSVIGVILLIIFLPTGFFYPLIGFGFMTELWPD